MTAAMGPDGPGLENLIKTAPDRDLKNFCRDQENSCNEVAKAPNAPSQDANARASVMGGFDRRSYVATVTSPNWNFAAL
jgi:hypothetical protein